MGLFIYLKIQLLFLFCLNSPFLDPELKDLVGECLTNLVIVLEGASCLFLFLLNRLQSVCLSRMDTVSFWLLSREVSAFLPTFS